MKWCKDNIDLWKEVIETISYETKRSVFMIEKDTIQSIFLYELSKFSVPFVFKGGTSLSKVFGLIDRFSEDIDLSSSKKLTDSEKKYIKKLIMLVRNDRKKSKNNPSSNEIYNITNILKEIISSRFYENDYNNITKNYYMKNMNMMKQ